MKKKLLFLATLFVASILQINAQQCREATWVANDPVTYPCDGDVDLIFTNGAYKEVNFTNFSTIQGFNLEVFLSTDDDISNGLGSHTQISTQPLQDDNGGMDQFDPITNDQIIDVSGISDINMYDYVIIQCTTANVKWAHAQLGAVASGSTCDNRVLSIDDNVFSNISLFPNPSKGKVTLKAQANENAQVSIYNILGKVVYNKKQSLNSEMNLSNLKAGIYMVKISSEAKQTTKRLIIE